MPRWEVTVLFGNCSQHSSLLAGSHCGVLTISFIKENTLTLSPGAREAMMPLRGEPRDVLQGTLGRVGAVTGVS